MTHLYVSTYCQHEHHSSCRLECKICKSPCLCPCHGLTTRLEKKIDQVLSTLATVQTQERVNMTTVQQIKDQADKALAAIKDESDKDDAIILLVEANSKLISDLRQQLADAIAANDPTAMQSVLDALTAAEQSSLANSAKVVAAVNANAS